MVLLLAPSELTRLVEKAVEWVQCFLFRHFSAIDSSDNGSYTTSHGEFSADSHLEELCDGLAFDTRYAEFIRCDSLERQAFIIDAVVRRVWHICGVNADRVAKVVLVTLQTKLLILLLAVDHAEVADSVRGDVKLIFIMSAHVVAHALLECFAVNHNKLLREEW